MIVNTASVRIGQAAGEYSAANLSPRKLLGGLQASMGAMTVAARTAVSGAISLLEVSPPCTAHDRLPRGEWGPRPG